jgi:hypothetical protein
MNTKLPTFIKLTFATFVSWWYYHFLKNNVIAVILMKRWVFDSVDLDCYHK